MLVIDQNHCEGPVLNALALASLLLPACLLACLPHREEWNNLTSLPSSLHCKTGYIRDDIVVDSLAPPEHSAQCIAHSKQSVNV